MTASTRSHRGRQSQLNAGNNTDANLPHVRQAKAKLPHATEHCPNRPGVPPTRGTTVSPKACTKPWHPQVAALNCIGSRPLEVCRDEDCRQCFEPQPQLPVASPARSACGEFPQRSRSSLVRCHAGKSPAGASPPHAGRLACKRRVNIATLTTSTPHKLITKAMGTALPSCSTPTSAAAPAATLNCAQPIKAEALPALAP